MMEHAISEARLLELGEAERRLDWARGTVQDYVAGRRGDHVFDELIITLTADKYSASPLDPRPLTPSEILGGKP
jgi:hypothetical protein